MKERSEYQALQPELMFATIYELYIENKINDIHQLSSLKNLPFEKFPLVFFFDLEQGVVFSKSTEGQK